MATPIISHIATGFEEDDVDLPSIAAAKVSLALYGNNFAGFTARNFFYLAIFFVVFNIHFLP